MPTAATRGSASAPPSPLGNSLRILAIAIFLLVAHRGIDVIFEDPFAQIGRALAENGSPDQLPPDLKTQLLRVLEVHGLPSDLLAKIIANNEAPVAHTPAEVVVFANETAKRYDKVATQLPLFQNAEDPELKSFGKGAEDGLNRGYLDRAETFVAAAELRNRLLQEVEFTTTGKFSVEFTNGWDRKNIVEVATPQLRGIQRRRTTPFDSDAAVSFHKGAAAQLQGALRELEQAGLLPLIAVWCGDFERRLNYGFDKNRNVLSSHALGIAFDINCPTFKFGDHIALDSEFEKFLRILDRHGFLWGGDFPAPDPAHFQVYRFMAQD
jgi:hypothetical protein